MSNSGTIETPTISVKPYMFSAMLDWLVDCGYTPHVGFIADYPEINIPSSVKVGEDGSVIMNISSSAITNYFQDKQGIAFNARFNGVSHHCYIPMGAIFCLVSKETGHGATFNIDPIYDEGDNVPEPPKRSNEPKKPFGGHLRVVK